MPAALEYALLRHVIKLIICGRHLLACWSRYFPESLRDGPIGVRYSLFIINSCSYAIRSQTVLSIINIILINWACLCIEWQ